MDGGLGDAGIGRVRELVAALRSEVERLEPQYLSGEDAAELVRAFAEVERLGAAGRTLASRRVESTEVWRSKGYRTAAQWMATETGISVGQAIGSLQTARALGPPGHGPGLRLGRAVGGPGEGGGHGR